MGSRATSRATTPIGNLANGYLDEFIIETSTNVAAASQLTVDGESGLGESEIIEPVPDWFNLRCHKPYCPAEKDNKDAGENVLLMREVILLLLLVMLLIGFQSF
jgi:hypothetical protein